MGAAAQETGLDAMTKTTTITIMRYRDTSIRWWPKLRRHGSPWHRVYEIDWLRFTVMVR